MFKILDLKYEYNSLSPFISEETLKFHHDKHHQSYVDKLNAAVALAPEIGNLSIEDLLSDLSKVPESIRAAVRNMGGGHYNHAMYWDSMSPNGGGEPSGALAELITNKYGSFSSFQDAFTSKSMSLFGSGWVWLLSNGDIVTTNNQDTPISIGLDNPLICLDVWEHAYYIDTRNKRDEYVKNWWNVVDWKNATDKYNSYTSNKA